MLTGTCHCGACGWTFQGTPESVTACNCTLCRRYGVLWAYDWEGERISVTGPTAAYTRRDNPTPTLEIRFCPTCAAVVAWRAIQLREGRRRIAVNVRLTDSDRSSPPAAVPEPIARLPVDHFDGLVRFDDLPRDGRCVADLWF